MTVIPKKNLAFSLAFILASDAIASGNLRANNKQDQNTPSRRNVESFQLVTDVSDAPVDENIILNIVENKCCDESWIEFEGGKDDAYKAISQYVQNNQNEDDIRANYGSGYQVAQTWIDHLGNTASMANVAASVSSTCNTTCFDAVSAQLNTEFTILQEVNDWNGAYNNLNDRIAYVMHSALTFGYNNVKLSSQQQKVDNPFHFPNWLTPIINLSVLGASFLGPVGVPMDVANVVVLSAKTAQFVINTVNSGSSSTSTGTTNFAENDMLDLSYAYLYQNVTGTYSNMNTVAGNQASAIASNWGRLKTFNNEVYSTGVVPSDDDTDTFLNDNTAFYEYTAFEWLMSSKYGLCMDQNYGFSNPSCNSNSVSTKTKKAQQNSQCDFQNENPMGGPPINTWESKPVNVYTWLCDLTNAKNTLNPALVSTLNANTYAQSSGLIKNGDFPSTVLNECNDSMASSCTGSNITFSVNYLGTCGYSNPPESPSACTTVPRT